MIRAATAFGGAKAYDISIACPCRECDVRSSGCGRICSDYKKYKFVLAILNGKRQAKDKEYMKGILRGVSASQVSSLYNGSFLKVCRGL